MTTYISKVYSWYHSRLLLLLSLLDSESSSCDEMQARVMERTPSMSELNEIMYGQVHIISKQKCAV